MLKNQINSIPVIDPANWAVVCDFDGTITPFDVTDAVLTRFARKEWEDIESEWVSGHITAHECMERQVRLIQAEPEKLNQFLDGIELTPGFENFANFCRESGIKLHVVSDGLDYSIKRILGRHGLDWLLVTANHLVYTGQEGYRLEFPHAADGCPSGVCKCEVASAHRKSIMLIGDGLSDLCLAGKAQFVLAKEGKELLKQCRLNNYPHLPFNDFNDVQVALAGMLEMESRPCPLDAQAAATWS